MIALALFSCVAVAQTSKTMNPGKDISWGEITSALKSVQGDFNKLKQDKQAFKIARRSSDQLTIQTDKEIFKLDRIALKKDIHYAKSVGVKNPMKIVTKHNKQAAHKIIYRRHNKAGK
jgi:hypothetical protein